MANTLSVAGSNSKYKATSSGLVDGTFEGYFHFVPVTRIVNGVFEPGQLQFEAVAATIPAKQPQSLGVASLSGDVDETRSILQSDTSARDDRYLSILLLRQPALAVQISSENSLRLVRMRRSIVTARAPA